MFSGCEKTEEDCVLNLNLFEDLKSKSLQFLQFCHVKCFTYSENLSLSSVHILHDR